MLAPNPKIANAMFMLHVWYKGKLMFKDEGINLLQAPVLELHI